MGLRARLGKTLDELVGKERTDGIRRLERGARQRLATKIAPRPQRSSAVSTEEATAAASSAGPGLQLGEADDRRRGWIPSDPFVPHPQPTMTRHDLLRGLHEVLSPRTYFEIGVNEGASLTLSRTKSIGVDPDYAVRRPLHCDLHLVRAKSDDFFSRPDALAHFDGVPIDLAFIDGMHLSEFALRDFINVERHLAPGGVTVFDDILPRNPLEAARVRRTGAWAGDVYKAVEVISRRRPDLAVVLVNTWPTGTAIVVRADPRSTVLPNAYASELPYLKALDPQQPPQEFMSRTASVDPAVLLFSEAWPLLRDARGRENADLAEKAKQILRSIPTVG